VTRKTVVIVEDQADIRDTLREIFEGEGIPVATAPDGRAGLEVLRAHAPDCVLILDLIMPIMDGVEMYEAMRRDPLLRDVPVVISTSDPTRAPPGVLILRKPVRVERLLDVVTQLMRGARGSGGSG
jgi:CheY-like chemotaxis protein